MQTELAIQRVRRPAKRLEWLNKIDNKSTLRAHLDRIAQRSDSLAFPMQYIANFQRLLKTNVFSLNCILISNYTKCFYIATFEKQRAKTDDHCPTTANEVLHLEAVKVSYILDLRPPFTGSDSQ